MTDDLDARLRSSLQAKDLPAAPDSIPAFIASLSTIEASVERPRWARAVLATVVAVALIATAALGLSGLDRAISGPGATPTPTPSPSAGSADVTPSGTVGEALAARAAGTLHGETISIRGFWSARPVFAHTCAAYPGESDSALEKVSCHEGEYGITEFDEMILTLASPQPTPPPSPFQDLGPYWAGPRGPYLTPFIPSPLQDRLLNEQILFSQEPLPIVLAGHFDDPQAADCDTRARQACQDRFVIEKVVSFDPPPVVAPSASAQPVDTSIVPVSRSHPSAAAKAVLQACGAFGDLSYQVARLDAIIGMGLIAHARDAARYVPLWGVEPEIQTDDPAWIIEFSGRVDVGSGYSAEDPVCVVVDGRESMFAPGFAVGGLETFDPPSPPSLQTLALPSLAP